MARDRHFGRRRQAETSPPPRAAGDPPPGFAWPAPADPNDLADWNLGDGVLDGDPLDGTGVETVVFDGEAISSFSAGDILRFEFPAAIQMAEGTAFGFLLSFDDGDSAVGENIAIAIADDASIPVGDRFLEGTAIVALPSSNAAALPSADLKFLDRGNSRAEGTSLFYPEKGSYEPRMLRKCPILWFTENGYGRVLHDHLFLWTSTIHGFRRISQARTPGQSMFTICAGNHSLRRILR
ncbi:MAG: hypothetical protein R3F11_28660 [Verrucomicrobiales bacterium]